VTPTSLLCILIPMIQYAFLFSMQSTAAERFTYSVLQTCSITALLCCTGVEKLRTELDMVHWNREGFKVRTSYHFLLQGLALSTVTLCTATAVVLAVVLESVVKRSTCTLCQVVSVRESYIRQRRL
jgi:hypothetical protein